MKAESKVIQDALQKRMRNLISRDGYVNAFTSSLIGHGCPDDDPILRDLAELDQMEEQKEWGKLTPQQTVALFVTLSPEPGSTTAHDIINAMSKLIKPSAGLLYGIFNIEQNGTSDNLGHHPHSHCLLVLDKSNQSGERSKMKAKVERNLKRFKTKSDAYLQVKSVSAKGLQSKIDYVLGNKVDPVKRDAVALDRVWREQEGFQDIYGDVPEEGLRTPLAQSQPPPIVMPRMR